MFSSFRDEIEKLAGDYHPFSAGDLEKMHKVVENTEARKTPTAVERAVVHQAPSPVPAVKAEAASGKKALGSLFKVIRANKKLFGAIGGVGAATAGALALRAVMNKREAQKSAPKTAVPVND